MKATGIGGATIFNLSSAVQESHAPTLNNLWPAQTYRSPGFLEEFIKRKVYDPIPWLVSFNI